MYISELVINKKQKKKVDFFNDFIVYNGAVSYHYYCYLFNFCQNPSLVNVSDAGEKSHCDYKYFIYLFIFWMRHYKYFSELIYILMSSVIDDLT